MFGIGMQEIVLICAIALIVVGPKRLPELARALGKGYGEFRRAFDEMRRTVETDFQTEEIRRSLLDLPPPPPQTPVPPPRPESLVPGQPAGSADPGASLYPAMMDAAPPPPEHAGSAPAAAAEPPPGPSHA